MHNEPGVGYVISELQQKKVEKKKKIENKQSVVHQYTLIKNVSNVPHCYFMTGCPSKL